MAIYTDLNPSSSNRYGVLVLDVDAIRMGLRNLFSCPIGNRGRIFQPEYGSGLFELLQEPVDGITANAIRANLIHTCTRWEPRVDIQTLTVTPNYALPGYTIGGIFVMRGVNTKHTFSFQVAQ